MGFDFPHNRNQNWNKKLIFFWRNGWGTRFPIPFTCETKIKTEIVLIIFFSWNRRFFIQIENHPTLVFSICLFTMWYSLGYTIYTFFFNFFFLAHQSSNNCKREPNRLFYLKFSFGGTWEIHGLHWSSSLHSF